MRGTRVLLAALLALGSTRAACPGPGFGSGRHLAAVVVLDTCRLLDRALVASPGEVARYLDDVRADGAVDWAQEYRCPEEPPDGAFPPQVERQVGALPYRDTMFDLPLEVASHLAACFSDPEPPPDRAACEPCADYLNLKRRALHALTAKADAVSRAVSGVALGPRCAADDNSTACQVLRQERTPGGLLRVQPQRALEAAFALWTQLCGGAGGDDCCGSAAHGVHVRNRLADFEGAAAGLLLEAVKHLAGAAFGAARAAAARARLGVVADRALVEAGGAVDGAFSLLSAQLRAARSTHKMALGVALLGGDCPAGGEPPEQAAAWGLARASVGRAAAALLGRNWTTAPAFSLTARRGLRALQLALCHAQRASAAAADLSHTVVTMLAKGGGPPPSTTPHTGAAAGAACTAPLLVAALTMLLSL